MHFVWEKQAKIRKLGKFDARSSVDGPWKLPGPLTTT